MKNTVFELLCGIDIQDILEYMDHLGGLYLTDQQLGDIHMLAYSGQREEAIKEILALVVPAITINTKVLS